MRTNPFSENVVDLESFALAFRPLTNSTEIIQYTRYSYTEKTITKIKSKLKSHLVDFSSGDSSLITSLTTLYLVVPGILELRSYKDQSNNKFWTIFHTATSTRIDFDLENQGQAGFLQDKKNLDYLYNLGVFGTFTKDS